MPIYDYKCGCGNVMTDQIRKYEETVIKCNSCGADAGRLFPGKFVAHGLPNGFLTQHKNTLPDVPSGTRKRR